MALGGVEIGDSAVVEHMLFSIVERAILPLSGRIASLELEFRSLRACIENDASIMPSAPVAGSAAALERPPSPTEGVGDSRQSQSQPQPQSQLQRCQQQPQLLEHRPEKEVEEVEVEVGDEEDAQKSKNGQLDEGTYEQHQSEQFEHELRENGAVAKDQRPPCMEVSVRESNNDFRFVGSEVTSVIGQGQSILQLNLNTQSPRDETNLHSPGDTTAPPSLLGTQATLMPSFTPPSRSPRSLIISDGKMIHSTGSSHQSSAGPAAPSRLSQGSVVSAVSGRRQPDDASARALASAQVSLMRFPMAAEAPPVTCYRSSNSPPLHSRPSPPAHSRPLAWSPSLGVGAARGVRLTPARQASPRGDQQSPFRQTPFQQHVQWPHQMKTSPQSELRHVNSQPVLPQQMPSWHWVSSQQQANVALSRATPQPQRLVH